jgi:predicted hotdog family 3-hydroxylacyl-ACP dehydratase
MSAFVLPQPAVNFLPHRPPMCLLDTLLACDDSGCRTEVLITAQGLMVDAAGLLEPVALVEMIAQSFAAMRGFDDQRSGRPVREGFLVGVRRMEMHGAVAVGDRLEVTVQTSAMVGAFAVAEGVVRRGDEVVASGSLKLWIPEPEPGK